MKIYYPAGITPDLLNQTQTCYHLNQRGELLVIVVNLLTRNKRSEMLFDMIENKILNFASFIAEVSLQNTD